MKRYASAESIRRYAEAILAAVNPALSFGVWQRLFDKLLPRKKDVIDHCTRNPTESTQVPCLCTQKQFLCVLATWLVETFPLEFIIIGNKAFLCEIISLVLKL